MGLNIGDIALKNELALAPMAGVCDMAFRRIVKKYQAGLIYAEMVSDKGLFFENDKTKSLLTASLDEYPLVQQIFGREKASMAHAVRLLNQQDSVAIIDINMGCPVPKVALKNKAGSYLMRDIKYAADLVGYLVSISQKPITVKMRTGWDNQEINAPALARALEKVGVAAIAIHGRTREQAYRGCVDYQTIRAVKKAVSIPVFANGDVIDGPSAKKMLTLTGCDGLMIGRAALGNPFIFREIKAYLKGERVPPVSLEEREAVIMEHYNALVSLKGEHLASLLMRSHGPWYVKGLPEAKRLRQVLVKTDSREAFLKVIQAYFKKLKSLQVKNRSC